MSRQSKMLDVSLRLRVPADTTMASLRWLFGDAHVYAEASHQQCAAEILAARPQACTPKLVYASINKREFCAADFEMIGEIPDPIVTTRPELL